MVRLIVRFPEPYSNGSDMFWLGELNFILAFFNTIAYRLENGSWGSRFPVVMGSLYDGRVPIEQIDEFEYELSIIRK